jgi:hypothetical protein
LCGTSKVEAVHSVLDRTFYGISGISTEVFDARLSWWLLGYNRRRLRALGKQVPPDVMPPKVVRGLDLLQLEVWWKLAGAQNLLVLSRGHSTQYFLSKLDVL